MRVLIATGGSGGHIFPALQTALALQQRGHEVFFAGVLGMAQKKIQGLGFPCVNISAKGLNNRSLWGIGTFIFLMGKAFVQSIGIIKAIKPDKIIGFGGYGSFALIAAGAFLGIPSMIHEQNVVPGKANRVLSLFVRKIAVSFKVSVGHFDAGKTVWTGCPCHDSPSKKDRREILLNLGLSPDKKIIALLGGSQGSQRLNEVFFQAMAILSPREKVQAVHMTGAHEYENYKKKYQDAQLAVVPLAFVSPIEELYAVADVVISRAGAATISELGAFGIASILVPYPFAGNHQKYNAHVLQQAGAAIVIEQDDLSAQRLIEAVDQCKVDAYGRTQVLLKTRELFIADSANCLAEAVETL